MQRLQGLLFALVCVLLSCSCQLEPLTEVVLSIDTNYAVPDELAFVNIEVSRIEGHTKHTAAKFPRLVDLRSEPLPMTLGLSSPGGGNTFEVAVTGLAPTQHGESSGKVLVKRRALFEFVSGKTLLLAMNLDRACERQECGDDQTCGDGGKCIPIDQRGKLPPWQGTSPTLDPYEPSESDGSVAQSDASMDAGDASPTGEPPPSPTRDAGTDASQSPPEESTGRDDAALDGGTITPREDASTTQDGGADAGLDGGDLPPPPDLGGPPRADDIVDLAVGTNHACVVLRNGQVWCWGGNDSGQLGVPRTKLHCPL